MRSVNFYQTPNGKVPVEDFLNELNPEQAQKVTWVMQLIEELNLVPKQYFKKLTGTNIWEIRIIHGGNIFRILGFFVEQATFVATHGFIKKAQKTPKMQIQLAEKYKNDYLKRFCNE